MDKIAVINFLIRFVKMFSDIVFFAILGRVILSWLSMGPGGRPGGALGEILYGATEPFISLARKLPHRVGLMDFSPIIALFGIDLISMLIINILQSL